MKMFTVRTLTNVSMESINVIRMLSVEIRGAITHVVVKRDFTETASTVLISMSAVRET